MIITAAVVQLNSGDCRDANVDAAAELVAAASRAGATLVLLPEYVDYLGPVERAAAVAEPIPGPSTERFGALARDLGITLVAGSMWERSTEQAGVLHNTVTVFDSTGTLRGRYRKLHTFDADLSGTGPAKESSMVTAGDELVVVEADGLRLGIATCYDLRFPEVLRLHALAECDILCVPSAFRVTTGRDHWEVLLRARALENQCHILAADQYGLDGRGIWSFGRSMIVDPWGIVLTCMPDEVGYAIGRVDLDRQRRIRARMPVLQRRRIDVYELRSVRGVDDVDHA
jgi:predicted amidohydrolase